MGGWQKATPRPHATTPADRRGQGSGGGHGAGPQRAQESETHQDAGPGVGRWGPDRREVRQTSGSEEGERGSGRHRERCHKGTVAEGAAAGLQRGGGGHGDHPQKPEASRLPGHHTGSHRQRPPAQRRSRRNTQDADWPPPQPLGGPPRGGPTTATDDTDEPQPAPWKQVSQGTYRRPPPTPHTHPPCPTLFPHPPAHRGTPEKHITQGHPPGHGGQGVTPTRGEAISGPRLTRGREGERHGTGKAGRSPVRGRGRAGSTGEGRQCTRGKGCEAGTRVPAQGEEKGPRHARQTSTGSHHHTHEGSPMTPGTPGGLSRPRALHDPAPPTRAPCAKASPPLPRGGGLVRLISPIRPSFHPHLIRPSPSPPSRA